MSFRAVLPRLVLGAAFAADVLGLATTVGRAAGETDALPAYVGTALTHFSPAPPPGWSYTVTVRRGDHASVESFDPTRPPGQQWLLQLTDGRPPTASEVDRYARFRESTNAAVAPRAAFERGDLDLAHAAVVKRDDDGVTLLCDFRGDIADPTLAHLELLVRVARATATVSSTLLRLKAPYSPVFSMKMEALEVETVYGPASEPDLAVPVTIVSRFRGSVFWFWSVSEDLRLSYAEYRRAASH